MAKKVLNKAEMYLRNFMFGVEDSLVSTVGLLSGVAVTDSTKSQIFATGVILIFVEALSMGIGSFLAEDSSRELVEKKNKISPQTLVSGAIMFFSYLASGILPLSPYVIYEKNIAFYLSIGISLASLFLLGAGSAYWYKRNVFLFGFRMSLLGGVAILAGVAIGNLFQ